MIDFSYWHTVYMHDDWIVAIHVVAFLRVAGCRELPSQTRVSSMHPLCCLEFRQCDIARLPAEYHVRWGRGF